ERPVAAPHRPRFNASMPRDSAHEVDELRPIIVLVDDEPGIVDFVELGLRHEDLAVVSAASLATGLETIRRVRPKLVILDVGLPDGEGFALLQTIRLESSVPVIMLTARGDVDDRVRGLDLGADDYIAKPFHFN